MKNMIRIITMILSISCMMFINGFTTYAEDPPFIDLEFDTKDGLQLVFNAPDVASSLVNKLKESATSDTYTAPEMRLISGSRAMEYISINGNLRAWTLRIACYYVGNVSVFKGLTFRDSATGEDLEVNCIYITYVDNSGDIRKYKIVPKTMQFSLTWRGYCDLTYTGGTYSLNGGTFFPLDSYSHSFRLLSDFDSTNYNLRVSQSNVQGVYYNTPTQPKFYPEFDSICYNTYLIRYGAESQYYTSYYPEFFIDNFSTNYPQDNANIDNKDSNIYNYYYNNEFLYGNTYNYNDTINKVQNINNYLTNKYPDYKPWQPTPIISDNYKDWGEDDILFTIPKLEIPTETLPTSVLEDGATIINYGVGLLNTIDDRFIIILLVLGVIGIIWSITGA